MSLKERAFSSIRWTAFSMGTRAGVAFLQLAVLARILSPEDFGLQALAMTVIGMLAVFSDLGISSAIIHYDDISDEQLSSLYWLNVGLGVFLTLVVLLLSPLVAGFYANDALQPILLILSFVFIINASAQQLRVIAEKELQFSALARIEIASTLIGFTVALSSALLGAAVYALTYGYIATVGSFSMLCWLLLSRGWRPRLAFKWSDVSKHVRFGIHLLGVSVANTLSYQADVIVAGRMFSAAQVGLYFQPRELSMRIMLIINPIVTRVGLPLIAKVQNDRQALAKIYADTILMTASINFPVYAALALFAPEVVGIVLGSKWMAASGFMRAVAIWCAIRSIGNPIGSLLVGTGRTRQALVSSVTITLLVFSTVWLSADRFGLVGIPYALAALYTALIIPFWYFNVEPASGLSFVRYHTQLAKPAAATAAALLAAWSAALGFETPVLRLLAGGISGGIVYLLCSIWWNRRWITAVRQLVGRSK